MNILIIGCGPAGLAAAHAAVGLVGENNVEIMAPKRMTLQRGPLLIQRPIPGINTSHPDGTIHQRVIGGSILDYRYKLYGDINIGINGDQLRTEYHAWNHRATYMRLWGMYQHLIEDVMVDEDELQELQDEYDLVVSTANAYKMCRHKLPSGNRHEFVTKEVAVTEEATYRNQPDDTIIFNAGADHSWVRSSRIFGVEVTEWPVDEAPEGARIIQKPISTTCDCYPRVLRTGRFGAWRNETWVDTAYWDVYTALTSMTRRDELEQIA